MGLFAKIAGAEASYGKNYPKTGKYWVIIDIAKKKTHTTKSVEMLVFETHVIRVMDNGEPNLKPGEELPANMNATGTGPRPNDLVSFVFIDGVKGNETRAKSFILKIANETDPKKITEGDIEALVDPNVQASRDVVLEIHAAPQKTEAKKDIVASQAVRRISAADVKAVLDTLAPEIQKELGAGRLERMLAMETAEASA